MELSALAIKWQKELAAKAKQSFMAISNALGRSAIWLEVQEYDKPLKAII